MGLSVDSKAFGVGAGRMSDGMVTMSGCFAQVLPADCAQKL